MEKSLCGESLLPANEFSWGCCICYEFSSRDYSQYLSHLAICSDTRQRCVPCGVEFHDASGLKRHRIEICKSSDLVALWDSFFAKVGFWAARTYRYPYSYFCMNCDYKTTQFALLKRHLRTCLTFKSIKCEKCPFLGTDSDCLRRHLILECPGRIGPYICPICEVKTFSQKSDFKDHLIDCATRRLSTIYETKWSRFFSDDYSEDGDDISIVSGLSDETRLSPLTFRARCPFCEHYDQPDEEEFCRHLTNCYRLKYYPEYPTIFQDCHGAIDHVAYCHILELYKCTQCHIFVNPSLRAMKRHTNECK